MYDNKNVRRNHPGKQRLEDRSWPPVSSGMRRQQFDDVLTSVIRSHRLCQPKHRIVLIRALRHVSELSVIECVSAVDDHCSREAPQLLGGARPLDRSRIVLKVAWPIIQFVLLLVVLSYIHSSFPHMRHIERDRIIKLIFFGFWIYVLTAILVTRVLFFSTSAKTK